MASFIQEQNEIREDYVGENTFNRKFTWRNVLCKTTVQGWMFIVSFAVIVPALTYYLVINKGSYKLVDTYTCYVNSTFRVPCGQVNITEHDCVNIDCCYDKPTKKCYHYLPSRYSYDLVKGSYKASRTRSPFSTINLVNLKLTINEINSNQLSIYLHEENVQVHNATITEDKNYTVDNVKEKLMVEIFRPDGDLLLSTTKGPLIASENYWEWTVYLSNHSLFGIDQTLITLDENSTLTKVFYFNKNDHSSIPVFWAYKNGKFHGVSINHDGPIEMVVLPSNMVVLKSLTGGFIEITLSVGPTPKLLHDQQRRVDEEGVPYWLMGIHVCKKQDQYYNMSYLVEQFGQLDSEADSYCIDENLFTYLSQDNSVNKTSEALNGILNDLSAKGKKFLLNVPPQVLENSTLYDSSKKLGLLYIFNDSIYRGKYLKKDVVYPDYSQPANNQKYLEQIDIFLQKYINISIDGFILTDNWPVNEDFKMDNSSFPYFNKKLQEAMSYTIQWNATFNNISHISKHNSYGPAQYDAFKKYYQTSKVIISATKSLNQIEPTIVQNVDISWKNLNNHLVNILFNSIAGNHLVSLPVCGDTSKYNDDLQESICLRWYIMAATMPLFRVSSPQPWRNPDGLKTNYAQKIARDVVDKRKSFIPYYYSILTKNQPVIRPMFYDYYENTVTFSMDHQYMIGEKILVAHPLTSDRTKLSIYLPPRIGVWYEFWGGEMFRTNKTNPYINIDVVPTDFLTFVAQGSVVALVKNTEIQLIVALNSTENKAEGSIQIDDIAITFRATDQNVTVESSDVIDYTLVYIKLYFYENFTSYVGNYPINNINLNETAFIYYVEPTTTETPSTTVSSTTTEISSTEETSTVASSTTEATSSTKASTTESSSTTKATSTTESSSTTEATSTTESSSTTEATSTTKALTTEASSTTVVSTTPASTTTK